jgi:hypothetical protein
MPVFSKRQFPTMLTLMFGQISFSTIPSSTHASRSSHSSHKRLAYCLALLATKAGLPCSARPSIVPCADDNSSRCSEFNTSVAGLNVASASYPFASPTELVTNVTLVHPFKSHHQLKEDSLADAETRKKRAYKTDYHAQDLAFASLACNSFCQQGSESSDLLCYLRVWLIADRHAQRTCFGTCFLISLSCLRCT